MPILRIKRFVREDLKAHPDRLYVFGDNFQQRGLGGQAAACRGEPNAVGIPTKRSPRMTQTSFLSDNDYDEWQRRCAPIFAALEQALREGREVALPADGIGTGLAQLEKKAPRIWHALQFRLDRLETFT